MAQNCSVAVFLITSKVSEDMKFICILLGYICICVSATSFAEGVQSGTLRAYQNAHLDGTNIHSHAEEIFTQYPLSELRTEYAAIFHFPSLTSVVGGQNDKPFLTYTITSMDSTNLVRLSILGASDDDRDAFTITMDQTGNVLSESYCKTIVQDGIVHTTAIATTAITITTDQFIGAQKVIRYESNKQDKTSNALTKTREWLISSKEAITTLLQLPVWVASISNAPSHGIDCRWVVDGDPIPVRILATRQAHSVAFRMYRLNKQSDSVGEMLALLEYTTSHKSFSLPDRISIGASGKAFTLQKLTESHITPRSGAQ